MQTIFLSLKFIWRFLNLPWMNGSFVLKRKKKKKNPFFLLTTYLSLFCLERIFPEQQ